ncbi:MAG TPA: hypothetical protein VFZ75_11525 [Actinomycetota bacterium]|nr:hypothetical protein [Actinomycetota bacterium]
METWFPLVFLAFVAAVVAIGVLSHHARIRRQRELMALAHAHGLDFAIDDPFGTLGEPFTLFAKGDGRGVENVLWGTWQGLDVRAFDHWYYEESTDSNGRSSRSYSRFSCALVPVDAACPRLAIAEENVLTRLADALAFHDLRFESEEFNRRFTVRSDDERFASALVDARMMAWLLHHGEGYAFEVIGNRVLCWTRRVSPASVVHLLGTTKGFRGQIPDVVRSLYPNG